MQDIKIGLDKVNGHTDQGYPWQQHMNGQTYGSRDAFSYHGHRRLLGNVRYPEYGTHDHMDVPTDGHVSINILTLYFFQVGCGYLMEDVKQTIVMEMTLDSSWTVVS